MTRIYTTTFINRPIEQVYEFVTTPGNWPHWHPSSLGVEGDTDHSLSVGESCTEAFHVAGRKGQVVWTVTEREVPRLPDRIILGQVTGVAVDSQGQVFVLARGEKIWDSEPVDPTLIAAPTVFRFDAQTTETAVS